MTDRIERVARAYCEKRGIDPDEVMGMSDSDYPDSEWWVQLPRWHEYKAYAREQIAWAEAIRENPE